MTLPPRVLVVAGEASGDALAASTLLELQSQVGPLEMRGMGGDSLCRAGVHLDVDLRHLTAMGVSELVRGGRLPRQVMAFSRILGLAKKWRPTAALLVDVPDFNLPLGARLRQLGVPVLGYVAPQFWAWRYGRLRAIADRYDRLACILPFEVIPLRFYGVDATFVGHPALEYEPTSRHAARTLLDRKWDERRKEKWIALLPGSRPAEVATLLLPMVRSAARLRRRHKDLRVLLPKASSVEIDTGVPEWVQVVTDEDAPRPGQTVLAAADGAIVASGTAALEASLRGTPQVVVYKLSWPTFVLGRLLVRTRFIAMPNILMNSRVVPELLQSQATVDPMTAHLSMLLEGGPHTQAQRELAVNLRTILEGPGATKTTAKMLAEMLG